ncbi:MAG: TrlF family AAA-like ATPase [Polyangiaceae bacterium]
MTTSEWPYPGSRWWKFDFHVHTPASLDTYWAQSHVDLTPEDWLLVHMSAGADCVAITDHNSGAWIDKVKNAYAAMAATRGAGFRELHLFPGVELSVNGGFHLLALLDSSATSADIDTLLGMVEYEGHKGDSDGVTRKSAIDVVEAVFRSNGLAIPAHADQPKGLLRTTSGTSAGLDANTLRQVFACTQLRAMELVDRDAVLPAIYTESRTNWAPVLGSDWHGFSGTNEPGSRYTWVKMSTPNLAGLSLALLDGQRFSVRRSDATESFDPFVAPDNFIRAVEIQNAVLMGRPSVARLEFNPALNALVGGRGSGKSTVVHALRLAYGRASELDTGGKATEPHRAFTEFCKVSKGRNETGALRDDSRVSVEGIRQGVPYRLNWTQADGATAVEEYVDGSWTPSDSSSVSETRFPIRLLSQGQIAALVGDNHEALLRIIDQSSSADATKRLLATEQERFRVLRAERREALQAVAGRDSVKVELTDIERKLASLENEAHAQILRDYQRRQDQRRATNDQFARAARLIERIEETVEGLDIAEFSGDLFAQEDPGDREALAANALLRTEIRDARVKIGVVSVAFAQMVERTRKSLGEGEWQAAQEAAKALYQEVQHARKAEGVDDPGEYDTLLSRKSVLEAELAQLALKQEESDSLSQKLTTQLQRMRDARRQRCQIRAAFLRGAVADNKYVRIELLPMQPDMLEAERSIRAALNLEDERFAPDIFDTLDDGKQIGLVADLFRDLPGGEDAARSLIESRLSALAARFECAAAGESEFGTRFDSYLQREIARTPELLDTLLIWSPEDGLSIKYSPKGDGQHFTAIGRASAGQRAAAMLAFLLAHGDEPLILDQPEDDLDNHLIYDLIVKQIRENKSRRQLLIITHNPNIVVNGDAEMIHGLDLRGGQCQVTHKGSLQDADVRAEVCRVMEGGQEAFASRYRRLGSPGGST